MIRYAVSWRPDILFYVLNSFSIKTTISSSVHESINIIILLHYCLILYSCMNQYICVTLIYLIWDIVLLHCMEGIWAARFLSLLLDSAFAKYFQNQKTTCHFMHLPLCYNFPKFFVTFHVRYQIFHVDFLENSFFGTPSLTSEISRTLYELGTSFDLFDDSL